MSNGYNAGTLRHWKYALGKPADGTAATKPACSAAASALVEVQPVVVPAPTAAFELELGERKLRIPPQFDAAALGRLLAVLERR